MLVLSLLKIFHENRFFVGAVGASLLGLLCRAFIITQSKSAFPKELRLVGEKPGKKSFSLRTRLSFYFNCSRLYNEVWTKVCQRPSHLVLRVINLRLNST